MEELTAHNPEQKKGRGATKPSFDRLLNWLDKGVDSNGQKYEEMRWRLIEYFDRRQCQSPDKLADETFDRVMKWLEKQNRDYDSEPAKICYQTAKYVFHEYLAGATVSRITRTECLPSASLTRAYQKNRLRKRKGWNVWNVAWRSYRQTTTT